VYRRYRDKADLVSAAIETLRAPVKRSLSGDVRRDLIAHVDNVRRNYGVSLAGTLLMEEPYNPRLLELFRQRMVTPSAGSSPRRSRRESSAARSERTSTSNASSTFSSGPSLPPCSRKAAPALPGRSRSSRPYGRPSRPAPREPERAAIFRSTTGDSCERAPDTRAGVGDASSQLFMRDKSGKTKIPRGSHVAATIRYGDVIGHGRSQRVCATKARLCVWRQIGGHWLETFTSAAFTFGAEPRLAGSLMVLGPARLGFT
jgi:hypothetical protein